MAARTPRTNTPTEQNKEDNSLMIYRLTQVEVKIDELSKKLDTRENLKRSDLTEFKDAIFERFAEVRANLEKQIDEKADKSQVEDLRGLVKWGGGFITTLAGAFIVYYFTNQ